MMDKYLGNYWVGVWRGEGKGGEGGGKGVRRDGWTD